MLQPQLLIKVIALLHKHNIGYMLTGSIVSSIQGEPRATHDVDIVIHISDAFIPFLLEAFQPPQYYISREAIEEAILHKSMFNLLDTTEGDKVDFWILTDEAFDQSRFKRKKANSHGTIEMNISTPEDTILMKLKWANLSGGSEKQFTDALRVYELQFSNLDLNYLEAWVIKLEVKKIWERLKTEAQPLF